MLRFDHQGRESTLSARLLKNEWTNNRMLLFRILSISPDALVYFHLLKIIFLTNCDNFFLFSLQYFYFFQ